MKKCPYCAEEIQDEATVCRWCGKSLETPGCLDTVSQLMNQTGNILMLLVVAIPFCLCLLGLLFGGR